MDRHLYLGPLLQISSNSRRYHWKVTLRAFVLFWHVLCYWVSKFRISCNIDTFQSLFALFLLALLVPLPYCYRFSCICTMNVTINEHPNFYPPFLYLYLFLNIQTLKNPFERRCINSLPREWDANLDILIWNFSPWTMVPTPKNYRATCEMSKQGQGLTAADCFCPELSLKAEILLWARLEQRSCRTTWRLEKVFR